LAGDVFEVTTGDDELVPLGAKPQTAHNTGQLAICFRQTRPTIHAGNLGPGQPDARIASWLTGGSGTPRPRASPVAGPGESPDPRPAAANNQPLSGDPATPGGPP